MLVRKRLKYCAKLFLGRFRENNKRKPLTIQLPITYKCNFDCVMCGMRTMTNNKDLTPEDLKQLLKDSLFSKIENVGLNGGEPFILKNLLDYVNVLVEALPKLKHIYIISNGYFTNHILETSQAIKQICSKKKIKYHLSISLDGIGDMQNKMRGHINAFDKTIETCQKIMLDKNKFCDEFNTICTITKINVYNLAEIESYTKIHSIPITYNVATIHKRLNNDYKYDGFSIFTDEEARMLAAEFLYCKFLETKEEMYFARFYYVQNMRRIASCQHRSNVVTITPNGAISYCAVFSKEIGNGLETSSNAVYFNKNNQSYKKNLHKQYCESCSHYSESLSKEGYKLYFKEIKKEYSLW